MAERFERLQKLHENLYVSGAPVIISAGALLKDTQTDSIIVQLKFHSVAPKTIKAVKVSIAAQDVAKQPIQGVEDYQYLDLNIKHGQEFGANKAVVLQSSVARFFSISALTVVFTDESQWSWDSMQSLQSLPASHSLHSALASNEMVKQYQIATNKSAQYVPIEEETIWRCSCGEWNGEPLCSKCKLARTTAFAAFNKSQLNADMSARLAAEQAKREAEQERRRIEREQQTEADRILAEESEARRKKIKKAAIIVSIPVVIAIGFLIVKNAIIIPNQKYDAAMELLAAGNYIDARDAFAALDGYRDSEEQVAVCVNAINEQKYQDAYKFLQQGMFDDAINAFNLIVDYKDSQSKITEAYIGKAESYVQGGELSKAAIAYGKANDFEKSSEYWQKVIQKSTIATSWDHIVGVKIDGTVVAVGDNSDGQCNVSKWNNIVSVSVGDYHTVGLKNDGTVVAVGSNSHGQCNVTSWTDIIAIAAYDKHTLGLKLDGTVVATGINTKAFDTSKWTDIVAIAAGGGAYAVGLKSDGTAVAVGWKYSNECDVSSWKDVIAVSASEYHTVGVTADGRVLAVGKNNEGQCNVSSWRDIISISTGYERTIGIKRDGTVVVAGGGWMHSNSPSEISKWENIVSTASYTYCVMGLRADGVIVGADYFGEEKQPATEWTGIKVPNT